MGFPGGSDWKESACNVGDPGSVPGLGRSPGEGKNYPLQYYCLENSMERGAWWATVHGVAKREMQIEAIMRHYLTTVRMAIIKKFYNQMLERMWKKGKPPTLLVGYT